MYPVCIVQVQHTHYSRIMAEYKCIMISSCGCNSYKDECVTAFIAVIIFKYYASYLISILLPSTGKVLFSLRICFMVSYMVKIFKLFIIVKSLEHKLNGGGGGGVSMCILSPVKSHCFSWKDWNLHGLKVEADKGSVICVLQPPCAHPLIRE